MIVPTRFGLKYAPIPTLALEYEDDLKGVVDATGESSTSLYVYRDENGASPSGPTRKLHVVELPMLTRTSETQQITRQLQQDNGRFLSPGVVSETQLKRLLDRLVQNLPDPAPTSDEKREPSLTIARETGSVRKEEASESELEESAMEESVMEESVAEASQSEEHDTLQPPVLSATSDVNPSWGAFISLEAENNGERASEDDAATDAGAVATKLEDRDEDESSHGSGDERATTATTATGKEKEQSQDEAEEDAKKTKALRSESDVSEEEVQSEELEYFSEDGSDEDSF